MPADFIPILMQIGVAAGFGIVIVILTHFVGPRVNDPEKLDMYECGVTPYGGAPARFSVKFFLVAVLFVLFDIESIFLYPWAVIFKRFLAVHGPFIFIEMLFFIGILFVGLLYVWRRGALDWE